MLHAQASKSRAERARSRHASRLSVSKASQVTRGHAKSSWRLVSNSLEVDVSHAQCMVSITKTHADSFDSSTATEKDDRTDESPQGYHVAV
jgi:hypothetical protein